LVCSTANAIDQPWRIGRQFVAAPGHMLVRPRQHRPAAIENGGTWRLDVEDF
jgi:hypothetical protein